MYDIRSRDKQRGWCYGWYDLYCELAKAMLILLTGTAVPRCVSPLWVLKTANIRRQTKLPPIRADPVRRNKSSLVNQWTQRGRLPRIRDAWL